MSKDILTDEQMANDFSGPVLFYYVWWILHEAQKKKINTLYFLARDGYLLREIALLFCEKFNIKIQCKYLYCSRMSLRMPSYHLIGEEAKSLLLLGGYRISLKSLMDRLMLDEDERKTIYTDCKIDEVDEDKLLSYGEFEQMKERLANSQVYSNYIVEKSKRAYEAAVGYFKQEGLFEQPTVAIVDSGWVGSMQRSLRQILEAEGYKGKIIGFYFGMYCQPKSEEDGEYLTWYFKAQGDIKKKVFFNNNLFELMLSAPSGMTEGYEERDGQYVPVLAQGPNKKELESILRGINAVIHYAKEKIPNCKFEEFNAEYLRRDTYIKIKRYMSKPKRSEVEYFGERMFCDDITEGYMLKLAGPEQIDGLKNYLILHKLWRKLRRKKAPAVKDLLWTYGTIAFLPRPKQWWYRLNIYIWEWLKFQLL